MLVGCVYGEYSPSKCFGCALSNNCDFKRIASHRILEKSPDATTEDFTMGRGEFDVYKSEFKFTVPKEALLYEARVASMRRGLGI